MTPRNVPVVDEALPSVGELVRAALERKELSIRDAAARTEGAVSHSQIARILRGESARIRPQTLTALSRALQIPIGTLRLANGAHNGRVPTPFVLPPRADELSVAERRVIVNMISALLAAHDGGAK